MELLPTSKILTAITATGPKKLCAKGRTKFPMLKPDMLMIANACASLPYPRLSRYASAIIVSAKLRLSSESRNIEY